MKLADFINKHLTHNRDEAGDFGIRVIIHIPVGLIMSIVVLGWGLVPLFIYYEANEDLHTADQAWKDIFGAMIGFAAGMIIQLSLLIIYLK